jgi:squalene-hopene/tetraprenyl-beta-curcumene cyclase
VETAVGLAREEIAAMTTPADALDALCDQLVEQLQPEGFWAGRLASSALATATAASALCLASAGDCPDFRVSENGTVPLTDDASRICAALAWLADHQNADGGWGDTPDSPSNLATTLLAVSALRLARRHEDATRLASADGAACGGTGPTCRRPLNECRNTRLAQQYLAGHAADGPQRIVAAVRRAYGGDRTFAVPILMNLALAGSVDWCDLPGLPFELAALPHGFYKVLRLHVVSYALPALVAIGLLIHRHSPPRGVVRRLVRRLATPAALRKLGHIQPDGGGFLEATPLTSFVTMALVSLFGRGQPVAAAGLEFLRRSQRADGSWPIDTNLSVWVTTSAVSALGAAGRLSRIDTARTARWIVERQTTRRHPYTHAAAGGWPWTHLPGGVPDADDTAGAVLALAELDSRVGRAQRGPPRKKWWASLRSTHPTSGRTSIDAGVRWLLDLQNRDGGWPTFCRGWGKLPFDRSAPDLTAHALRALACTCLPSPFGRGAGGEGSAAHAGTARAIRKGLSYLARVQQADGSWTPLWFGNQSAPEQHNPVVGTALVLRALELFDPHGASAVQGVRYLLAAQNGDGGWGGAGGVASSAEETALAVAALTPWRSEPAAEAAIAGGVKHLLENIRAVDGPRPIGLYFSRLWYSEQMYPLVWTIEALGRAFDATKDP